MSGSRTGAPDRHDAEPAQARGLQKVPDLCDLAAQRYRPQAGGGCRELPLAPSFLAANGRFDPDKIYVFFYSVGLTGFVLCEGTVVGKSVLLKLEARGRS